MIRSFALALAAFATTVTPAVAAPRGKKAKVSKPAPSPEPLPLEIELPSRTAEETIAILHPHENRQSLLALNVAVVAWFPQELRLESRSGQNEAFRKSAWPGAELGLRSRPLVRPLGVALNGLFSAGFQHLTRSAQFKTSGYTYEESQNLFLIPLTMGVEASVARWEGRQFAPSLSFALTPTFGILSSSSISSSGSPMAWAYEARLSFSGPMGGVEDGRWIAFASSTWNAGANPAMNLRGYGAGLGLLF